MSLCSMHDCPLLLMHGTVRTVQSLCICCVAVSGTVYEPFLLSLTGSAVGAILGVIVIVALAILAVALAVLAVKR